MCAATPPPIELADELHTAFARAFNAFRPAALEPFFEPDAILVTTPGVAVHGAERRRTTAAFLDLGIPIQLSPRHTYICGDLALLISDHLIAGIDPGGSPIHIAGTSADVARRGPDGGWRIVIDNPPGTA